jgi:putative DNA primase/helicase
MPSPYESTATARPGAAIGATGAAMPALAAQKATAGHRQRARSGQPEPERYTTLAPFGRPLWEASRPIEPGTVAATYLKRRGCALPPDDSALRWHPEVRNPNEDHTGPALVALMTDVQTGEPISLHRTWLKPDGSGKAALSKPRRLLVRHRSDGVVRLWPDEDVTLGLVLGEGIETCLAAARAGLMPVWATLSAHNLAAFPVLPGIEGLTVLVDHDHPNPKTGKRAGIEAAQSLIERYVTAGLDPDRDVRVILPPTEGHDAADLETSHV